MFWYDVPRPQWGFSKEVVWVWVCYQAYAKPLYNTDSFLMIHNKQNLIKWQFTFNSDVFNHENELNF